MGMWGKLFSWSELKQADQYPYYGSQEDEIIKKLNIKVEELEQKLKERFNYVEAKCNVIMSLLTRMNEIKKKEKENGI